MTIIHLLASLGSTLLILLATAPAFAQSDGANTTGSAQKPANAQAKPKSDSEKAAARANSEAEMKRRQEAAQERQKEAYLGQVASLGLSAEQAKQVSELPARQAAWQKDNEAEIASLRDRMMVARGDGDVKAVKSITEELQSVMRTRPSLESILTKEQFQRMNEEAIARMKAAREKAGVRPAGNAAVANPAANNAPRNAPEVVAIHEKIKAARKAGDTETVERLQTELRMLKDAVRKARAAEAAARKDVTP